MMTNLKEAQRDPEKMKQFIKEHKKDAPGDEEKLEATLRSAVQGRKKSAQETSSQDSS